MSTAGTLDKTLNNTVRPDYLDVSVIRIRLPSAFAVPDIADLVYEAFKTDPFSDADRVMQEIPYYVQMPHACLLVGRERGDWQGMAFVTLPSTALVNGATVYHFYCKGSPKLRQALIDEVVRFAREGGQERLLVIDANNRARGFQKVFAEAGDFQRVGDCFTIDLRPSIDEWSADHERSR